MFSWFRKKEKPLKDMSLKEVTAHLYGTFPSIHIRGDYDPPNFRCSRWILLCGPAYQDGGHFGSFILDASQIYEKVKRIDENMSTSDEAEEQAKNFFPEWVKNANLEDETVTLLDEHQRGYLKSWLLDFIAMESCGIWCPTCKSSSRTMVEKDREQTSEGESVEWSEHWVCSEGHLLHFEEKQVRFFF